MTHLCRRLFLVGTDTEIGKTRIATGLLRSSAAPRIIPFKPAESGQPGARSDSERLAQACSTASLTPQDICPLRYQEPLAPGIAHARARPDPPDAPDPLEQVRDHLERLVDRTRPQIVLVEGAGGLHVPMPGQTWQPQWITALSDAALVVARPALGTINHTILTLDALRALGHPVVGFVLNHTHPADPVADPSLPDNASVIARHTGVPHLATIPHTPDPDGPHPAFDALWAAITSRYKTD